MSSGGGRTSLIIGKNGPILSKSFIYDTYQEPDVVIEYIVDSIVDRVGVQDRANKFARVPKVDRPVVAKVTPLVCTHSHLIKPPQVNRSTVGWAV